MALLLPTSLVRSGIVAAVALAAVSLAGCDVQPHFVGKWKTDRSQLQGSPSWENDLAELLSPSPKFTVEFTKDGKCNSTWSEDGKEGSRSGTWKMVKDQGLKWIITVQVPPDEDAWEVKVGSVDTDTISLQSTESFRRGSEIHFRRSW